LFWNQIRKTATHLQYSHDNSLHITLTQVSTFHPLQQQEKPELDLDWLQFFKISSKHGSAITYTQRI